MAWERRVDLLERYKAAGLTARDLANETGISPSGIARRLGGYVDLEPDVERRIIGAIERAEMNRRPSRQE